MSNTNRRLWWRKTSVETASWLWEHFTKWNLFAGGVLGAQVVEVGSYKSAIEGCCYVIWVTLCEALVPKLQDWWGQRKDYNIPIIKQ